MNKVCVSVCVYILYLVYMYSKYIVLVYIYKHYVYNQARKLATFFGTMPPPAKVHKQYNNNYVFFFLVFSWYFFLYCFFLFSSLCVFFLSIFLGVFLWFVCLFFVAFLALQLKTKTMRKEETDKTNEEIRESFAINFC